MNIQFFNDNKLWIITLTVFLILITFLDSNNILDKMQLTREIRQLKVQKKYYLERIAEDSTIIEMLKDVNFLEKYAREKYFMRKKNEIIYIIED